MRRDLGGAERTYWVANQWSPNNVLAIAELDGQLDLDRLRVAQDELQRVHPLLGLRVLPDAQGRQPRFVPRSDASLPLTSIDVSGTDLRASLDAWIAQELNHVIKASERLGHVVYVHNETSCALILSCLHIIADATSVMIALRDLLDAYARPQEARAVAAARTGERLPPCEALMPEQHRGLRSLPLVLRTQSLSVLEALRRRPRRLPAQAQVPMEQRRNGYLRRTLAPAQVERLREACTTHSVTVHGALTAALGLATADELALRREARAALNVGSPLSLRPELPEWIADHMGSYVCTLNVFMDVDADQSLWTVARQVNEELQRRRAREEPFAVLNAVAWIAPGSFQNSRWMVDLADKQGPGNLCLSNIGHFDMPREVAGVPLRSAHWCASLSITGYFLCAVCTTSHGLQLDFAYVEDVVKPDRARRIVDRMLGELTCAVNLPTEAGHGRAEPEAMAKSRRADQTARLP